MLLKCGVLSCFRMHKLIANAAQIWCVARWRTLFSSTASRRSTPLKGDISNGDLVVSNYGEGVLELRIREFEGMISVFRLI